MSGQNRLLRIGVTCAVIVIGSAIVGSQLSIGNLTRIVPTVADEEDAGTPEEESYASSGDEVVAEGAEGEGDVEHDTEATEDARDEPGDEAGESFAEVTDGESAEEPFANDDKPAPEGQAGDPAAGESTEDEPDEDEESWIIGPSPDT